jgi:hypothetical protein
LSRCPVAGGASGALDAQPAVDQHTRRAAAGEPQRNTVELDRERVGVHNMQQLPEHTRAEHRVSPYWNRWSQDAIFWLVRARRSP